MTDSPTIHSVKQESSQGVPLLRTAFTLGFVVALAIMLRVAFWWFQAQSGAVQAGDPEEYYRAALHLLRGGYYDTGKWIRPPVYPLFLALAFGLVGVDTSRAMLLQAILSGAGVLVFAWYGWQRFHSTRVALLSALIAAVYLPLASFGSAMFAEGTFVLLVVAALAALDRAMVAEQRQLRWAALAGALLACATLTRAVGLFFVPVAAVLVLLGSLVRRVPMRQKLLPAAIVLVAAVLVIAPWTLRNYRVHERLVLVDTNGAISMWYGTLRSEAEQQAGEQRLFEVENQADRQALALRMTVSNVQADPLGFLARARYKVASLFILQTRNYTTGSIIGLDARGKQVVFVEAEHPLWVSLLADLQYVPLVLAAIIGVCFAPGWRRTLPVMLFVLLSVALSALTIGHPRLRLPIVCVLVPYAAYTFASFQTLRFRQSWRAVLAALSCAVFLALIVSTRYVPWAQAELVASSASTDLARGNREQARAGFEQALALNPSNALREIELADLYVAEQKTQDALRHYRMASEFEPRNVYAHARQIALLTMLGQHTQARAELQLIAGYGRDTNDLYRYTWQRPLIPPPTELVPGEAAALGHYHGFAPATFDLASGRWTLGRAAIRLAPTCTPVNVTLRGPVGRTVLLEADDGATHETLTGAEQTVMIQPGINCGSAPLVVHITSPTSLLDLEAAPWMTGVAVLRATTEARP